MGTSLQRSALYFDVIGHCRDQPVDSLTDTMSDTSYTKTHQFNATTTTTIIIIITICQLITELILYKAYMDKIPSKTDDPLERRF